MQPPPCYNARTYWEQGDLMSKTPQAMKTSSSVPSCRSQIATKTTKKKYHHLCFFPSALGGIIVKSINTLTWHQISTKKMDVAALSKRQRRDPFRRQTTTFSQSFCNTTVSLARLTGFRKHATGTGRFPTTDRCMDPQNPTLSTFNTPLSDIR
ncbi:uncharacterized protein ACBT44_000257 isoform 1-T4 [Syngnathus typhle]